MNKLMKYFYMLFLCLFSALTLYELFVYLGFDSNYVGMFYLFFNFFIMFLLLTICVNYSKRNINIRISKNVLVVLVGFFASFVLSTILGWFFTYSDGSKEFLESIFVIGKVIKPIMYMCLLGISFYEYKFIK